MEPEPTDLRTAKVAALTMLAEVKAMREIAESARPNAIAAARAAALTYREIGEALGVSEGRVRQIEKGSV